MKSNLDAIKFESRQEIQQLMIIAEKYVRQNPAEKDNETLKRFYNLLDALEMNW